MNSSSSASTYDACYFRHCLGFLVEALRDCGIDACGLDISETARAARFRRSHDPWPRLARSYERRFWQLTNENVELHKLAMEMRSQLATAEQTIHRQQQTIQKHTELFNTPSWRLAQQLTNLRRRLTPDDSRRARWLTAILRLFSK